eukprot:1742161-Amphidinium_carterae.1
MSQKRGVPTIGKVFQSNRRASTKQVHEMLTSKGFSTKLNIQAFGQPTARDKKKVSEIPLPPKRSWTHHCLFLLWFLHVFVQINTRKDKGTRVCKKNCQFQQVGNLRGRTEITGDEEHEE